MPIPVQKMRPLLAANKTAQAQRVKPGLNQKLGRESMVKALTSTMEICFGVIAYHRDLLDKSQLLDRSLSSFPTSSQQASTQASEASITATPSGTSLPVYKIKPDGSQTTSYFLKTMKGIKTALRAGYLETATIILLGDPDDRNNILESYTFEFGYSAPEGTPSLAFRGRRWNDTNTADRPETVGRLQEAVWGFTKSLMGILEDLHPLPRQRWFDLKLGYNDRAPEGYHPAGFDSGDGEQLFFSTHSASEVPVKYEVDAFEMPDYRLGLSVASVSPFIDEAGSRNHRWDESAVDELAPEKVAISVPGDAFHFETEGLAVIEGKRGERDGVWQFEMDEDSPSTQPEESISASVTDRTLRSSNTLNEPLVVPSTPPPPEAKAKARPKPKPKAKRVNPPKTTTKPPAAKKAKPNTGGTFAVPRLPNARTKTARPRKQKSTPAQTDKTPPAPKKALPALKNTLPALKTAAKSKPRAPSIAPPSLPGTQSSAQATAVSDKRPTQGTVNTQSLPNTQTQLLPRTLGQAHSLNASVVAASGGGLNTGGRAAPRNAANEANSAHSSRTVAPLDLSR